MKQVTRAVAALTIASGVATGIFSIVSQAQQSALPEVNGVKAVTLSRKPTPGATKPEFTSVTLLPGRALMVQQITAFFPGKGEVNVLAEPFGDLEQSAKILNEKDTPNGDLGYRMGARGGCVGSAFARTAAGFGTDRAQFANHARPRWVACAVAPAC